MPLMLLYVLVLFSLVHKGNKGLLAYYFFAGKQQKIICKK